MVLFCHNETRKGISFHRTAQYAPSIEHLNGAEQPNLGARGMTSPASNYKPAEGFRGGGTTRFALTVARHQCDPSSNSRAHSLKLVKRTYSALSTRIQGPVLI